MQTDKTTTAPDFIPDFNRPEGFNITKTNKAEYMGEQYGWSSNERRWFKLTDKTTTESKQPLYKVLNEQRTQGEWIINDMGLPSRKQIDISSFSNGTIGHIKQRITGKIYSQSQDKEAKANAQYTALAVNNLHHLAEALEEIANTKIESVLDAALMKVKAQKALKLIS